MLKKILLTFLIVMFASIPAYAEKIETASPVLTGTWDFGGGELEIPNSTTLPATCNIGESYMDTNATSGQRLYLCESANTWALQGDGGAAGSAFSGITGSTNTTAAMVVGTGASLTTSGSGTIIATTSTALVANGANCSAGNYALGVDASGASESCTADDDVPDAADFGALALTGDVTSSGLATTVAANAVALTTDTVGNYAAGDAEAGASLSGDSATSYFSTGTLETARLNTPIPVSSFGITIDGGGSAITTGVKGFISVPYACTINSWDIFADQSGSIVIDVWKDTYANFPPTVADTIAGSEKPTLSSAQKNQDLTLSTWTTAVTAGDTIGYNVDSATTVTRVTVIIKCTKG